MSSKSPEIRFNGFTDDWEQRKLDKLAEFAKGSGYSKSDLKSEGTPVIHYGRLYTNYETSIKEVDTFVEAKENSIISKGNEVIVPASGETSEDISRASVVVKPGVVLGGDLNIIKPGTLINPTFLALTISNGDQQKELTKRAQGKSVVHIRNSDLKEVNLSYPKIDEQSKIGIFFEQLENTIALHQRELENLEKSKEGFLQKIFPKKGEIVPEIRLTNYTSNWKKEKLGNLVQWKKGKGLPKKSLNTIGNGKPVIHYADLYFFPAAISKVKHYSEENEGYLIKQNSLLFPMSDVTPNGLARTSSIQLRGVYAGGDTLIAELNEVNSDFLSYQINANSNKIMKYVTGTTIKHINSKSLSQLTVYITNKQEQEKIGSFLKKIDEKFFYHEEQLIILKQAKKAFLQKMFV